MRVKFKLSEDWPLAVIIVCILGITTFFGGLLVTV